MTAIDVYLNKIEIAKREPLNRIREIARRVVPNAEEVISYGMPTLQYRGKSFLGFDAHKDHIGIYPFGSEEIEVFEDKLIQNKYGFSRGTIRVPYDHPISETLLREIIEHRIKRIPHKLSGVQ